MMNSLLQRLTRSNSWTLRKQHTILFDSTTAASDVAFALGGQWDGCNGVVLHKCDEVAVSTAAALANAQWCHEGISLVDIKGADLSHAYLSEANLSEADLSGANLSLADLRGANLNQTNLSWANLRDAKVNEADLSRAIISGVAD